MRESCDIKRYARRPHATLIDLIKARNEAKKTNSNALNTITTTTTTTTITNAEEEEDEEAMDTSESFPK